MKFTVSSTDLLKQLQKVSGAIASNPVLTILEDFLFEIGENVLKISASNLEVHISTKMETETQGKGSVAIPAKILLDTLKALPEQPIKFEIDEKNFGVQITSAYGKYKLAGEDGADFPAIPQPDDVVPVIIKSDALLRAIKYTLPATSADEMRPAMTGVFFGFREETIDFVATDAHKLVKFQIDKPACEVSDRGFIIPKGALNLLKNTLPAGEVVQMSVPSSTKTTNAFFFYAGLQICCRLIDARYPDYNAVIPKENTNVMTISRSEFQSALKRIAIFANKVSNQVMLEIQNTVLGNDLILTAKNLDYSTEAVEQLPCFYEGEPIKIGFNAKFLVEMLTVLAIAENTNDVRIEMSTPNRAGILLPTEQGEDEKITMLMMPVMLSD